VLDAYLDE
jgi:hypothetical protein